MCIMRVRRTNDVRRRAFDIVYLMACQKEENRDTAYRLHRKLGFHRHLSGIHREVYMALSRKQSLDSISVEAQREYENIVTSIQRERSRYKATQIK